MPNLVRNKPLFTFFVSLLSLGIVFVAAAFAILTKGFSFSPFSTLAAPTSTVIRYGEVENATSTETPFQPLPTDTLTPTPTDTPTPLPTATPLPTNTPLPTRTPKPTKRPATAAPKATSAPSDGLPAEAMISGYVSHMQSHSLSCESRAASDWAVFFGRSVSENTIQSSLPKSDNPNKGFVGNVDGVPGQIPPNAYGVYAEPVAATLREFGVSATASRSVSMTEIHRQIAKGNPVIVWVVGSVWSGTPISYTASDGSTTTVAYGEHTVVVIGYDEAGVTISDGGMNYWRSNAGFNGSFSVLGRMAILHP